MDKAQPYPAEEQRELLKAARPSRDIDWGDWQPIETAPNDGVVLVYHPKTGIETRLSDGDFWRMEKQIGPTHWMPLPPPPQDGE